MTDVIEPKPEPEDGDIDLESCRRPERLVSITRGRSPDLGMCLDTCIEHSFIPNYVASKSDAGRVHYHAILKMLRGCLYLGCLVAVSLVTMQAQDRPYFVSYSHDMEDQGEIDIESKTAIAGSKDPFAAMASEFEVGVRSWWTVGFYLDGQVTDEDSAIYTGFRLENRMRLLKSEHAVNPVFYFEYENTTAADKTILEIPGHDGEGDLNTPNALARRIHEHEGELRLILSSNVRSWNFSENFISEKNLGHAPWEFGYAVAGSRPLGAQSGRSCSMCAEKIVAGVELYGGAGDTRLMTLRNTSHYFAPVLGWNFSSRARFNVSYASGLTGTSLKSIYRFGFVYEFDQLTRRIHGAD